MMEKLTKKIEFIGDKLNASNFTTEFRLASYKTKDGSKFDLSDAATIAYGNYRLEQAPGGANCVQNSQFQRTQADSSIVEK